LGGPSFSGGLFSFMGHLLAPNESLDVGTAESRPAETRDQDWLEPACPDDAAERVGRDPEDCHCLALGDERRSWELWFHAACFAYRLSAANWALLPRNLLAERPLCPGIVNATDYVAQKS
jgi:hypothetical protein